MNLKKRNLYLLFLIGVSCQSLASEESTKLDDIYVVDSSQIQSNTSVDMDRLEKEQAKDFKDVLKDESSLNIGNTASKSTQRIYLRGIESTNLNITIDGASQGANLFQHRGNVPQVDADILKRVDIQTSANAQSGKGALAGSIAMTTKDAQDFVQDGKNTGAIIGSSYSTINNLTTGSLTTYGVFDKYYGIYFNASGYDSDDYERGGDGEKVLGTASEGRNYFLKFSMLNKDDHSLRISVSKNTSEGMEGDDKGAPATTADLSERDYIEVDQDTVTAEHRYNPDNPLIDITTNIYTSEIKEESTAYDDGSISSYKKESIGGKLQNRFTADFESINNEFILGIDFSKDESSRDGGSPDYYSNKGNPVQAEFVTVESQNLGFFTQNTTDIDKLAIYYGARLDKYDLDIGNLQSIEGSEVSPNIGLAYQLTNSVNIFTNYSEASRATGIIPVGFLTHVASETYFAKGVTNTAVWGNDIKAETSKRKELGLKFNDSNLLSDEDRVRLSLTYFDTEIENLIEVYAGGTRGLAVTGLKNSEDLVETKGYEIKTSWENNLWFTSLSYTNAKTTIGGVVEKIYFANRTAAATGDKVVWYTNYQIIPSLSLGYTLSAIDRIDYDDGTYMSGYTTHGISTQWKPNNIKGLSLSFAIDNLTDKKYEEQTSTYYADSTRVAFYEPGRDYKLSLKYRF